MHKTWETSLLLFLDFSLQFVVVLPLILLHSYSTLMPYKTWFSSRMKWKNNSSSKKIESAIAQMHTHILICEMWLQVIQMARSSTIITRRCFVGHDEANNITFKDRNKQNNNSNAYKTCELQYCQWYSNITNLYKTVLYNKFTLDIEIA